MNAHRLEEARLFLQELAEHPPWLPYEPTLLPLLFSATRDDSTASISDLTALIERSQNLTARVLTIANSAVYALESTVTSLHRALAVLGFREVRTLVIMVAAVSAIKGAKLPREFDADGLWRHHLRMACIAKALAAALRQDDDPRRTASGETLIWAPDEAYAAGLLHDIGKVFLAAKRPEAWRAIEELRLKNGSSFAEAEDAYWSMDHAVIGSQVLHQWKLPRLLTDPINWHHAAALAPDFKAEAKLLCAADYIAHQGVGDNGELPERASAFIPPAADPLALGLAVKDALAVSKFDALMGLAG